MGPIVVSCEHASAFVPPEIDLGLDRRILATHAAWDPGTREVAEHLGRAFDAPYFLGTTSRLIADLNRSPGNPDIVPDIAFGHAVPGNQCLSAEQRLERIAKYHTPYWDTVTEAVRSLIGPQPVLHLSIHSFSPHYGEVPRPMCFGLMYDPARPLENLLTKKLGAALQQRDWVWGDNLPYDGRADALVTHLRGVFSAEQYLGYEIELNQRHLERLDAMALALESALRSVWPFSE